MLSKIRMFEKEKGQNQDRLNGIGREPSREKRLERVQLRWVELVKAIALIAIFFNHVVERIFGYPYIANPWANWPPLAERLAQLQPLDGFGLWNLPINLLRYLGWFGEQGVQLFLILSGFGLTWGFLARYGKDTFPLGPFYYRRVARIYPLWWVAHLIFIVPWLLVGFGMSPIDPKFLLSLLGIRFTPELFYYFSPAWWYVGLLIQLYLVYPLLWGGLQRKGPLWLLVVSCTIAFVIRGIGLFIFTDYLDAWQRGAIFITRLPEFVFGISLAAWLYNAPEQTNAWLRRPITILMAFFAYIAGMFLSLTLLGMTIAPFLLGVGLFVLLYAALGGSNRLAKDRTGIWEWVGEHSYSLYLMHHPLILALVPIGLAASPWRILIGVAAAALLTIVVAVILEWTVSQIPLIFTHLNRRVGSFGLVWRAAVFGLLVYGILIGGELIVRQVAPQETSEFGWGERSSLEPDSTFGWHLKPSLETRLRWESYDYTVKANALGFPGPEYPAQKEPHTLRIMTVGDAFTSAEGVDTDQAWPRLLEADLQIERLDQKVEVLNFGISGYGPNQYLAVAEHFIPLYRPDLFIIGLFVNDYQDVLWSNEDFQQSIGFNQPVPDSLYAIAKLAQLRHLVHVELVEPLVELLRAKPRPYGYFLGYFSMLEKNRSELTDTGQTLVADRLAQIKAIAHKADTRVIVVMIPAPVQVCKSDQLAYYPRNVDLNDTSRFDLDLPQRMTQEIARSLGIEYLDLRPILQATSGDCPYQPKNSHWTTTGHRVVAAYLAEQLKDNELIHIGGIP